MWSSLAAAEPTASAARQEARAHFERGLEYLDGGDLTAAAREFAAAHALVPSALAAYDAALAMARSEQPLSAVRLLRSAEALEAAPSLRQKMAALLEAQRARLGTLWLRVVDAQGNAISRVVIQAPGYSDEELRPAEPVDVLPGTFFLSIRAAGYAPQRVTVIATAGSRVEVTVSLEATASPLSAASPPPAAPWRPIPAREVTTGPLPADRARSGALRVDPRIFVLAAGVGAAGMAVSGAVLLHADIGLAGLSGEVQEFNASTRAGGECSLGNNVAWCRSRSLELNSRLADFNRDRILGAIGLGVGALTTAAGAILYANAARPRRSGERQGVGATLSVVGTGLFATGEF